MESLRKATQDHPAFVAVTTLCLGLVSGVGALAFSRSYQFNSDLVGWGDSVADRNEAVFWWGATISVAVLLLVLTFASIYWRGFRMAFISSITVCGTLAWVSSYSDRMIAQIAAVPLLPGVFVSLIAFGIHAGPGKWVGLLWVLEVNAALYTGLIAAVLSLRDQLGRFELGARS